MTNDSGIITQYRRAMLCKITSGAIPAIVPITHIAFGDGGVDINGEPIPPNADATALNNEIARYPIDAPPTYPINSKTTARYVCTIPAADLPGAFISEVGFVDGDGNFCAINTFYVKRKEEGEEFTFTLDDKF